MTRRKFFTFAASATLGALCPIPSQVKRELSCWDAGEMRRNFPGSFEVAIAYDTREERWAALEHFVGHRAIAFSPGLQLPHKT